MCNFSGRSARDIFYDIPGGHSSAAVVVVVAKFRRNNVNDEGLVAETPLAAGARKQPGQMCPIVTVVIVRKHAHALGPQRRDVQHF
jgi:hypothetical protein